VQLFKERTCKHGKLQDDVQVEFIKHHRENKCKEQMKRNNDIYKDLRYYITCENEGKPEKPKVLGVVICWSCYAFFQGVGVSTLRGFREKIAADDFHWTHQGQYGDRGRVSAATEAIRTYIQTIKDEQGNIAPNNEDSKEKEYCELSHDSKVNHFIYFGVLIRGFAEFGGKSFQSLYCPSNPVG
jgi:hypothetical protein